MGTPFLGEIKIISWGFNPKGWAYCNGQLLPINQNQALFSLLGTQYGGDGRVNFALPDTRGRAAMHMGGAHSVIGERGGTETVSLTAAQTPSHIHFLQGVAAQASLVGGAVPAATKSLGQAVAASNPVSDVLLYGTGAPNVPMSPASVTMTGQGQPHENRQPYLVLAHIIALQGVFPSRN
jgi:microcystin-dependent protein